MSVGPQSNKELDFKVIFWAAVLRASNNANSSSVIAFDGADYGLLFGEAPFFFTIHTFDYRFEDGEQRYFR